MLVVEVVDVVGGTEGRGHSGCHGWAGEHQQCQREHQPEQEGGLAHTTGDAAAGLGTSSNPPSTSTSCSLGVGPERNGRPLPLIRQK
ncbi:hypothetical protein PBY51_006221 [Eleginops maclovinus]|uniref:Uncharacterized protein n=1 Tax=Eleginops maclovinus TaxID=56733 RepID=A0AAN8A174_ELEMC|nr:hypothetical protein PBY51_006221 [Eleginops maclovinus]